MKSGIKQIALFRNIYIILKFVFMSIWQVLFFCVYYIERNLRKIGVMNDVQGKRSIKEFKNMYKGKRCFIICTGPSLKLDDLEKININNEISFSMNSMINFLGKTNYRPTFYCVQDTKVIKMFKDEFHKYDIPYLFIGLSNSKFHKYVIDYKKFANYDNVVFYRLDVIYRWVSIHFPHMKNKLKISSNCGIDVSDGGTVAYSALQLAKYMGFSKVYLLGADCDYTGSVNHFDGTHYLTHSKSDGDLLIESYTKAKKLLEDDDYRMYNASRGGKLDVFERIDLDSILK